MLDGREELINDDLFEKCIIRVYKKFNLTYVINNCTTVTTVKLIFRNNNQQNIVEH